MTISDKPNLACEECTVPNDSSIDEQGVTTLIPNEAATAQERILSLIDAMSSQRKLLTTVIRRCEKALPIEEVIALIDEEQAFNRSVYDAANICALLEREGAIRRVTADGKPYEESDIEPHIVVVDGIEYLEAPEPEKAYWIATEAGLAVVSADNPTGRLNELLEESSDYLPIYQRILALCNESGGASAQAIADAVDNDPLLEKPRLYSGHFVELLEKCDALEWRDAWITTDTGRTALSSLPQS